jgi:hypothetical protein
MNNGLGEPPASAKLRFPDGIIAGEMEKRKTIYVD